METAKAIAVRRSTRAYKPEQIKDQELNEIVKAAKLAPIARGAVENVHLTVIQNQALIRSITEAAQKAAGTDKVSLNYGAPTVIIVSGKALGGLEIANAACITENMLLTAADLGLGSVFVWGAISVTKDQKEVIASLGLPEGFEPIAAAAVGYPAEAITGEREPRPLSLNVIK
ncbi:MAG: nitroreductase family protein [Peptococcaceae bacterium]|jgi:nitroreductase|nr:nitroreductase family protein [Peptococcaceae bacterium]